MYFASDDGKIYSSKEYRGSFWRELSQNSNMAYNTVSLYANGKRTTYNVHKLVALAFFGAPMGRDVNHIDGDKRNNNVSNLEYCTRSENAKHAYSSGLKAKGQNHSMAIYSDRIIEQVHRLRDRGFTQRGIAKRLLMTQTHVWRVLKGINRAT